MARILNVMQKILKRVVQVEEDKRFAIGINALV
jgi:hypothetical protein